MSTSCDSDNSGTCMYNKFYSNKFYWGDDELSLSYVSLTTRTWINPILRCIFFWRVSKYLLKDKRTYNHTNTQKKHPPNQQENGNKNKTKKNVSVLRFLTLLTLKIQYDSRLDLFTCTNVFVRYGYLGNASLKTLIRKENIKKIIFDERLLTSYDY